MMTAIDVHTSIFNKVYRPYLHNEARTQIYYGGSSSGKSVFLAQRAVYDLLNGGRNYLIVRQVGRTLYGSVFTEVQKVISTWGLGDLFTAKQSNMRFICNNGYHIIFGGLDDVEKLKSLTPSKGAITDIWVEEATETSFDSVKQLMKRQRGGSDSIAKRITLSFNPIIKSHWIYEEYFKNIGWADEQTVHKGADLTILKTTYKDNRFLTKRDIYDLENENDKYYRDVYTYGNWGVLGNVIFKNWKVADLSDPASEYYLPVEQRVNRRHGLDFGFSSDPAAVPITHYNRGRQRIYVYDEIYETGLTNDVLAAIILEKIGRDPITPDSAEPKSITELRQRGVNAMGAQKGKDSVLFGIQWLQQQEIIVDKSCINMQNELTQYKWREDAEGRAMRQPVDRNNHLIDALRYAYEADMLETSVKYAPSIWN